MLTFWLTVALSGLYAFAGRAQCEVRGFLIALVFATSWPSAQMIGRKQQARTKMLFLSYEAYRGAREASRKPRVSQKDAYRPGSCLSLHFPHGFPGSPYTYLGMLCEPKLTDFQSLGEILTDADIATNPEVLMSTPTDMS
jgi:hypothetical protein